MKHFAVGVFVVAALSAAVVFSKGPGAKPDFVIARAERNPFTHLRPGLGEGEFQFAIVSDRTGGHRAKVFSTAVERINLLQPEFVVSVGDLIEGNTKAEIVAAQWKEFDAYVSKLTMPFFYVGGNHDMGVAASEKIWKDKLGRRYYDFVYKDILFVMLCSEDPPGTDHISKEQQVWLKKTLADNAKVRWTLVFVHRPSWNNAAKNGWLEVEKALADRPYTVFCGHVHRFQKYVRHGRNYYQLATTGGVSRLRGVEAGEFDHITWVTMKKDGPLLAHVMLDAIAREDLSSIESDEKGTPVKKSPTHPVTGRVLLNGTPMPGATIVFEPKDPKAAGVRRADAVVQADGSYTLGSYAATDGAVAGDYLVSVTWRKDLVRDPLPPRYTKGATSGLTATVRPGENVLHFELRK